MPLPAIAPWIGPLLAQMIKYFMIFQMVKQGPDLVRGLQGRPSREGEIALNQMKGAGAQRKQQQKASGMMLEWLKEREADKTMLGLSQMSTQGSEWLTRLGDQVPGAVQPSGPPFPAGGMPPFSLSGALGMR